jgi:ribonuclease PH
VTRHDGRGADQLRPVAIQTGVQDFPAGSAMITCGRTRVLCAASIEEEVPRWRRGSGLGWVTGEYAMLPSATGERSPRESARGRIGGRTQEIQRLIGRSLRSVVDLASLGEHSVIVDCDVIQADGGTRTAAITGGWVALALALDELRRRELVTETPRLDPLAAISVGLVGDRPVLDLDYVEDSAAVVDMNVVLAGGGRLVEIQGTAEQEPFSRQQLDRMVDLAEHGCATLFEVQAEALASARATV